MSSLPSVKAGTEASVVDEPVSWAAVFSLSAGAFGLVTAELLPVSILTSMAIELGVSNGDVGQTVTVTAMVAAFAGPLIVLGSGRIDRRVIVRTFMLLLIVSSALSAVAPNIEILLFARGMLGLALGGYWAMMIALALRLVPSRHVPRAVSIIVMGVSAATFFAAHLAAVLGEILGWRATFLAVACIGIVSLLFQLLVFPFVPSTGGESVSSFKKALSRKAVLIGIGAAVIAVSGHFAGFTFIRPFMEEVPQFSISTMSLPLLAFGLGGFAGNLIAGVLSARGPAAAVAGSALLIAGGALALVLYGQSSVIAFLAVSLWGFAFGGVPVAASVWNARAAPDLAESAGAILACSFQIAIAVGSFIGGRLFDAVGSSGVIFYAGSAATIAAVLTSTLGRSLERGFPKNVSIAET